jgi:hypothetical protein
MLAAGIYNQPATILYWQAGPPDEHNVPTDDFTSVDTVVVFQEKSRLQNPGDGQIGVSLWTVYIPPDEAIPISTDRLNVNGVEYNFHGDGWLTVTPRGVPDHIEATVWRAA